MDSGTMLSPAKGLIVALNGSVDESLRYFAKQHGFPMLEGPSAADAFRTLLRVRPRLVIVQVSRLADEGLELIKLATRSGHDAVSIAVSTAHGDAVEQAARGAGATYYLPGTGAGMLDEVVKAVGLGKR